MQTSEKNKRFLFITQMVLWAEFWVCVVGAGCKKQDRPAAEAPPPMEKPAPIEWPLPKPIQRFPEAPPAGRSITEPNQWDEDINRLMAELIRIEAEYRRRIPEPNITGLEPNQPLFEEYLLNVAPPPEQPDWPHPRTPERLTERRQMVSFIRDVYGLTDQAILEALEGVPRHWFVTPAEQTRAYADMPLPLGYDQTISQPYMVAYMTHLLELDPHKKVLEVGTGSGYQAAVLSEFTPYVYTIEIVEPLARATAEKLIKRGYTTIETGIGDGYLGWPEKGPFDAIIVTCAPDHIPRPLIEQLKPGGMMCIPIGQPGGTQSLILVHKDQDGAISSQFLMAVRFVPLIRKE